MGKLIAQFTGIILINLFAFLSVGYILDLIFESGSKFKIIFVVLSIFSLAFISHIFFKKGLVGMETLSPKKDDNIDTK